MKKVFAILTALILAVSLSACATQNTGQNTAASTSSSISSTEALAESEETAVSTWVPTKSVDFIVRFNAGGSSDLLARIFTNQGADYFENNFVVLNEGGGSCSIGLTDLISRPADGYAIGICNNGVPTLPLAIETPYVYKDELTALCMWGIAPYVVVVNASSEYYTLEDLMTAIKENPNGLVSGACSAGSNTHYEMEMLAMMVNSDIKSVIYDGGSSAIAALLGNNIDVTVQAPSDAAQYIESGDLRCVAVLSTQRMSNPIYADVPTAQEQGYDLVSECFQGCGTSKGVSAEIIAYYENCFKAALEDPDVIEAINNLGFDVIFEDSSTYQARWESTASNYEAIITALGDRLIIE